jgi:hypothetical protein
MKYFHEPSVSALYDIVCEIRADLFGKLLEDP